MQDVKKMEIEREREERRILVVRGVDDDWTPSRFLMMLLAADGGEDEKGEMHSPSLKLWLTLSFLHLETIGALEAFFSLWLLSPNCKSFPSLIQKSSPLCLAARGGIYKAKFVHRMPWARKHKW
jgi:hypothetical protein